MDERQPKIQPEWGLPVWFHHHGIKLRVFYLNSTGDKSLIIKGSAAQLVIAPYGDDRWTVRWEIVWGRHEEVSGHITMLTETLRRAFGLADGTAESGEWILSRYGGDSAEQHRYLRWRDCLNIPGPGTGHDGDPNISVLLRDDIKEAVRQLLELP